MELSLYGSQINLATRERTTPTFSHQPPVGTSQHHYRPSSALYSRPFSAQVRRPLSADSQIERKAPAAGFNLSKRSTSSSSLLKSLLAEPISRYWGSKTLTGGGSGQHRSTKQQMPTKVKSKKRSSVVAKKKIVDCSSEEESSMDEDTQESNNETELENIWSRGDKLRINPGVNKKPPLPRRVARKTVSKKASNLGMAGKDVVQKVDKKIDLPGRVSFSSNDPYEIDYSDYDDNEFAVVVKSDQLKNSGSVYDERNFQESAFEAPSKTRFNSSVKFEDDLASSAYETKEEKTDKIVKFGSTPESFGEEDDSNKIIEDYKKEIEDINRRREMELKLVQAEGASRYDPKQYTMVEVTETYVEETYRIAASCTSATDDTENENESPRCGARGGKKDVINEYYECINEIIDQQKDKTKHDSKEDCLNLNLNNETKPLLMDKNLQAGKSTTKEVVSADKNKLDSSSNAIIKNYFKVKEQNFNDLKSNKTSQKNNVLASKKNGKPTVDKSKSAEGQKSILRNPKKNNSSGKYSTSLSRQDSNISEFQMDKVVSWMSCNEDTFPKLVPTFDGAVQELGAAKDRSLAILTTSDGEASKATTQLIATDDESNFNFDPGRREAAGSQQSNYDDESLLANEITKSDFQALKTEVEYRLSNILDSRDSPDSSGALQHHHDNNDKDKVKDLFSYLDQVDLKCEKTLKTMAPSESDRSEFEFAAEPDYMETIPKMNDLLEIPIHQLARRVIKLSLRANELSNAMALSKDHLVNLKADKMKAVRAEKAAFGSKMKEQKKHYEDIIGRHQEFIDQLIKDKSGLCDKVTQLTRRIESQNQSWEHRLKTELERAKDTALAAEKIRREKWVRENTKKIKELTVKGLELEINKMTATHQKELAELKRQHKDELMAAVSELKLQYEQKEADIKQSLQKERDAFIERERQTLLDRFDKQVSEERSIFEQQRQHLLSEFDIEKDRNLKELKNRNQYFETQLQELKCDNTKNLEFARKEYVQMLKDRENKHKEELAKLQNQLEADFAIWRKKHEETAKNAMEERENVVRQQLRAERDQQIDRIVAKVDAETQKYQQEFDAKMNRLKEKHQVEMHEQEANEALLKQRYQDTRAQLAEGEATIQNMKSSAKQLELQLNHSKKLCDELLREKESMKAEARKEVQKDLVSMQQEREREIERIYCRVQQAIDKKDATISSLQKEVNSLKERCLKQDAIIRQQRIDYCIK
ncbi:centrosomal protein of 131 kDa [Sabethes cyaneus]|uniref:centrosomal protein of 131 kDa n=1 Tax=Sabethes cyaneus TaxID=53552 RepID=UPI00237ECAA3|nr:centrosomal protein of 131 kDa [Sabethes cyaneus]